MLHTAQLQKIGLLSDTVLYPEAVSFIRGLVQKQQCDPLPNSQVAGLLSIAEILQYDQLELFIKHQRERKWPPGKRDLETFYTALEEVLRTMRTKRLKDEFYLLSGGSAGQVMQETKELMALLAREFIQHLIAENGLLASELIDQRARQKSSRR